MHRGENLACEQMESSPRRGIGHGRSDMKKGDSRAGPVRSTAHTSTQRSSHGAVEQTMSHHERAHAVSRSLSGLRRREPYGGKLPDDSRITTESMLVSWELVCLI